MIACQYQNKIAAILCKIFDENLVKTEWDSVKFDGHTTNHKLIYAPRHDIAVGPFNSYPDLDIGNDKTKPMQSHPLTKKLFRDILRHRDILGKIWNPSPRCYLAIEIEFSGTSKHIFGSIINASASGSIGIVITNKKNFEKANRICGYVMRLEGIEGWGFGSFRNLIIFEDNEFLEFISKIKVKKCYERKIR